MTYNPTTWSGGDLITASKLNKIETQLLSNENKNAQAVYWELNNDNDTVENIIATEIKSKMSFSLSGSVLSILYNNETVSTITLPTTQLIPCTAIELNLSATSIEKGNTVTLTATFTPSNTTDAVTWSSSDSTKASVTNGVVTGVSKGSATITVICGSYSDTCVVTVTAQYADPVCGYILAQNNRIDYRPAYNYLNGGTFNDPFLKKVSNGQTVTVRQNGDGITGLYLYMYVYSSGTFTDKCSADGNDYVLTQTMLDMETDSTYGILISSELLSTVSGYLVAWDNTKDYTATQDCYIAFWFNIYGESDISNRLTDIANAIKIEVT